MKSLIVLPLFLAFTVSAQEPAKPPAEKSAPYVIPEDAVHQANPVSPTPESIAQGKKWYGYDCETCHGANGDGKGEIAADMKNKVHDLADPAMLKTRTDGELFYIIKNGKGEMPGEGTRLKPADLWNLVNYIRSLEKKKSPAEEKPAAEDKTKGAQ